MRRTDNPVNFSVVIDTANGESYRWAGDEADPANIPADLSFSSTIPGGYESCEVTLFRRIDLEWDDLNLFDTMSVYGPGGELAWQGRIAQLPRSHGDNYSIRAGAVGWQAHLSDDATFTEIYVDRDLSQWEDASADYQIQLFDSGGVKYVYGAENRSEKLIFKLEELTQAGGDQRRVVAVYQSPVDIGKVLFNMRATLPSNWKLHGWCASTRLAGGITGGVSVAGPSGPYTMKSEPAAGARFAFANLYYNASFTGKGSWKATAKPVVYGRHGLSTATGTDGLDGPVASDVVKHAVERSAPLLNISRDSIESTSFPIPQLAFREATTVDEVIKEVNKYHLYEWGVYADENNKPEFFFRMPDENRLCWEARMDRGDTVELEGDQAEDLVNGVFVTYQDVEGIQKTVGPIGSGADLEDAGLSDDNPDNPVNSHNIPRRWVVLSLSGVTTPAAAAQVGSVFLIEKGKPQRRGSLTVTGTIKHPAIGFRPVWEVKAGDFVRISDHPTDVPRRVLGCQYDQSSDSVDLTLDNQSANLDAVLARQDIALVGIIS